MWLVDFEKQVGGHKKICLQRAKFLGNFYPPKPELKHGLPFFSTWVMVGVGKLFEEPIYFKAAVRGEFFLSFKNTQKRRC